MKKLLFISLIAIFCSCKKEDSASLKDMLTNHTWKSTGFSDNGVAKDKWCWLSSLYNFSNDNKLFFTQGDNLGACFGTVTGNISKKNYTISADEKWIVINNGISPSDEADSFQVISISESTLKTKRIVNKDTATPNTWEDTYTAQ